MKVTRSTIKAWAKLGQRGALFAFTMPEIANKKNNLKLLTADVAILAGMDRFIRREVLSLELLFLRLLNRLII